MSKRRFEEDNDISIPLTEEEEAEAKKMAEIALKAELRASQKISTAEPVVNKERKSVFLTKQQREQLALENLEKKRMEQDQKASEQKLAHRRFITGQSMEERRKKELMEKEKEQQERIQREKDEAKESVEYEHEVKSIRNHYLGLKDNKRKMAKPSERFAKVFQFEWDASEDTMKDNMNPLYNSKVKINPLFGRGYIAGVDLREQRKDSNYLITLSNKRLRELKEQEEKDNSLTEEEKRQREIMRIRAADSIKRMHQEESSKDTSVAAKFNIHWSDKALSAMNERDWRIFREDFDIRIQGGRASLPLRNWSEANLPAALQRAIDAEGFENPSPIQRQAIPIGQDFRDIIGIAATGSGKTAAFIIPLLCYMLKLPPHQISRTDQEGPLAIVMAPTRELAMQIEEVCIRLAQFTKFKTVCVVGGQSIEEQGFILRKGVEVVIGTPGRIVDCLKSNLMVLNQCNYVVLDEADRMIDMGFEPQVIEVLNTMGGLLKSEDEQQLEEQVQNAKDGSERYRVTAMFSATMPVEVERIAKTYLRHPVVVKIGDKDSGKNKQIEQHVHVLSEGQKKNKLLEELRRMSPTDKAIVFVNSKKQGDTVGRFIDAAQFSASVLHGGKSQDQREETLELFRSGEYKILVATDVAGRGLDIVDVSVVINYDMPNKIENYCHRIGRTGRAGRSGTSITFVTDADAEVLFDLKNYLESTNTHIPGDLAKHPAAQAAAGSRNENGKLMTMKKDQVVYAK